MLVSARRLNELGLTDAELAAPAPVTETARALSAAELVASGPAEIEQAPPGTGVGLVRAVR